MVFLQWHSQLEITYQLAFHILLILRSVIMFALPSSTATHQDLILSLISLYDHFPTFWLLVSLKSFWSDLKTSAYQQYTLIWLPSLLNNIPQIQIANPSKYSKEWKQLPKLQYCPFRRCESGRIFARNCWPFVTKIDALISLGRKQYSNREI